MFPLGRLDGLMANFLSLVMFLITFRNKFYSYKYRKGYFIKVQKFIILLILATLGTNGFCKLFFIYNFELKSTKLLSKLTCCLSLDLINLAA